ncbi:uncharacterized protein LOC103577352 [Microplitis demolitor]|uniref:uncharacterized protein LOC103577352 n=1 Tax=Microplitis demolitor TaxID=69319 RepID=UPI0004CCA728|nr:uncharacterized protein LOC103577352 [Microplitis demolitor]
MSLFIIIQLFIFVICGKGELLKEHCLSNGNTCFERSQCCSNNCHYSRSFDPVCIPKIIPYVPDFKSLDEKFCFLDKSRCSSNNDCCSNNCIVGESGLLRTCNPGIKNQLDNFGKTEATIDNSKTCKLFLEPCIINEDCCSKECIKVPVSLSWAQFCTEVKPKIIEDHGSTTMMPQKENDIGCALIGDKCLANVDCCSKRCSNYPGTTFRSCV